MEITSPLFGGSSYVYLYIAAAITAFCFFCTLWTIRLSPLMLKLKESEGSCNTQSSSKKKVCGCSCSCGGIGEASDSTFPPPRYANGFAGDMHEGGPVVAERADGAERQSGASMMEQLVPEITTHALSYLDYPSLCRLSMTNSSMRRAANDDNAWKALYHKDFTMEQDSITPHNGWKAYYAVTRAVVNVNAEFYNIIRDRSLPAMGRLWLNADYVKCIHSSGEFFTGYDAVMESWQLAFNWAGVAFQIRDVRVRVLTDMAWVTMKAYVDMETEPFIVTNVYEFHNGQWYMVHHHGSAMFIGGGAEHQNLFG